MGRDWQDLIEDIAGYDSDEDDALDKAVNASYQLEEIQDAACLQKLYTLLESEDFFIRELVSPGIAKMDGIKALKSLLRALMGGKADEQDNDGLCEIVAGLLESNKKAAKSVLLDLVQSDDTDDRICALWAFGYIIPEISPDFLLEFLNDSNPDIRATVIGSLASFQDDPRAYQGVFNALGDEDEQVKIEAIYNIRYFKNPKSITYLEEMSKASPSKDVREVVNQSIQYIQAG